MIYQARKYYLYHDYNSMNLSFRKTSINDINQIKLTDNHFTHHETRHRETIAKWTHFSARNWEKMVWLTIFDYWLFGNAFVWLLMTNSEYRRQWIWSTLITMCEENCENHKIFISTQDTNTNMKWLLHKLWYAECWNVKFLNEDDDDDELFFYKKI